MSGLCSKFNTPMCRIVAGDKPMRTLQFSISSRVQRAADTHVIPASVLRIIATGLGYSARDTDNDHYQRQVYFLNQRLAMLENPPVQNLTNLLCNLSITSKPELLQAAALHGLACAGSIDALQATLLDHFGKAGCVTDNKNSPQCSSVIQQLPSNMESMEFCRDTSSYQSWAT